MNDPNTFYNLLYFWIALAFVLAPVQLFITAPYGRHTNRSWGYLIDNRLGWVIMEIVSPLVFAWFFLRGDQVKTLPMWIFFFLWMGHYFHRSILFPLRTRTRGKQIPMAIVLSAMFFNTVNGFFNGYWLGSLSQVYPPSWIWDPRFIIGLLLFITGAAINWQSDSRLIRLRKPGETGYQIPRGGLFRWVSCPNHLGEIIEWSGFALMCWNLPALSFAIWTAANLIPRAVAHHRWYCRHFEAYPDTRRAVIPFLI